MSTQEPELSRRISPADRRGVSKTSSFKRSDDPERRRNRCSTIEAKFELSLEDLAPVAPRKCKSSHSRLHNSMSALRIADEAPNFGATRLTGPAVFNEVATTEERRKRLAYLRISHHEKSKSMRNLNAGGGHGESSSSLDLDGDTEHSDGRRSSGGSIRGLFRKTSSRILNKIDSFSSLESVSNHKRSSEGKTTMDPDEKAEKANADKEKPPKKVKPQTPTAARATQSQSEPQQNAKKNRPRSDRCSKREIAHVFITKGFDAVKDKGQEPREGSKHPRRSRSSGDVPPTQVARSESPKRRSDRADRPPKRFTRTQSPQPQKRSSRKHSSKKQDKKYLALDDDLSDSTDTKSDKDQGPPKPPRRSVSPTRESSSSHVRSSLSRTRSGDITNKTLRSGARDPPLRRTLSDKPHQRRSSSRKLLNPPPRRISRNQSWRRKTSPTEDQEDDNRVKLQRPALCRAQSSTAKPASTHIRRLPQRTRSGDVATRRHHDGRSASTSNLKWFPTDWDDPNMDVFPLDFDDGKANDKEDDPKKTQRPALTRSRSGEVGNRRAVASTRHPPQRTRSREGSRRTDHATWDNLNTDGGSSNNLNTDGGGSNNEPPKKLKPGLLRSKSGEVGTRRFAAPQPERHPPQRSRSGEFKSHHSAAKNSNRGENQNTEANGEKGSHAKRQPPLLRSKSGSVAAPMRRLPQRTRSGDVGGTRFSKSCSNLFPEGDHLDSTGNDREIERMQRPGLLRTRSGDVRTASGRRPPQRPRSVDIRRSRPSSDHEEQENDKQQPSTPHTSSAGSQIDEEPITAQGSSTPPSRKILSAKDAEAALDQTRTPQQSSPVVAELPRPSSSKHQALVKKPSRRGFPQRTGLGQPTPTSPMAA